MMGFHELTKLERRSESPLKSPSPPIPKMDIFNRARRELHTATACDTVQGVVESEIFLFVERFRIRAFSHLRGTRFVSHGGRMSFITKILDLKVTRAVTY